MKAIKKVSALLDGLKVVPVVVLENEQQTIGLCDALCEGGIDVIEITLRHEFGLSAISLAKQHRPEMRVLAGTVNSAQDFDAAVAAGADGIISPGFTVALAEAARRHDMPYLPGVATGSEILLAMENGLSECKLFPAGVVGGVSALKAFSGPFAEMRFCPTGGVSEKNVADYLALPNVMCVGGSWLAPTDLVRAGDWAAITELCRDVTS
ncbi:MAG: bifunctional 4-hydroxy-2-oxoglutarate aldolase/2-dehydro-3-deoxy-phosphogluconate aldolase [Gammaproteobacteria bacterium]|nr:bifunctional 4-hydroxy-2-oxoglutarate aldolase/2-dehydro-3-deoxy-phosphogluconate aldolase [Gammaproteobacteria bacterium]